MGGQERLWLGMRSANDILSWVDGRAVTYRNFQGSPARTKEAEDAVEVSQISEGESPPYKSNMFNDRSLDLLCRR